MESHAEQKKHKSPARVVLHSRWHCELPLNLSPAVRQIQLGLPQIATAIAFCSWAQSSICLKVSLLPSTATANWRFFTLARPPFLVHNTCGGFLELPGASSRVFVANIHVSFGWQRTQPGTGHYQQRSKGSRTAHPCFAPRLSHLHQRVVELLYIQLVQICVRGYSCP